MGAPRPVALLAAVGAVFVGGMLGAAIGFGLARASCTGACVSYEAAGLIIGSASGAGGVGVVAVLVLRAMAEWQQIGLRR